MLLVWPAEGYTMFPCKSCFVLEASHERHSRQLLRLAEVLIAMRAALRRALTEEGQRFKNMLTAWAS